MRSLCSWALFGISSAYFLGLQVVSSQCPMFWRQPTWACFRLLASPFSLSQYVCVLQPWRLSWSPISSNLRRLLSFQTPREVCAPLHRTPLFSMLRWVFEELSLRMCSLPSSRAQSLALPASGSVPGCFNWTPDLDNREVHGQTSLSLLELRASAGFPPPAAGPASLFPLPVARCSVKSSLFLLDCG